MANKRFLSERGRELHRPMSTGWWLSRPSYTRFIFREISSAFCAGYAVLLMVLLAKAPDEAAFAALWAGLKSPPSILLHLVVLGFSLMNTLTTFSLAPRVLALRRGEDRVPEGMVAGAHYVAWAVVSIVVLAIALRG
jgi:fumarate reductase subunit C